MSVVRQSLRRFFVATPLAGFGTVGLDKDLTHRLTKVLRLEDGAAIVLCDNATGCYQATLENKGRTARLGDALPTPAAQTPLTLWLCLPKREAWETALRQATELGATAIQPLTSAFSQISKLNEERALAHLMEAAEQSERTTLPTLLPLQSLQDALDNLATPLWWASEVATPGTHPTGQPQAILVGPEGGFSAEEIKLLQQHKHVQPLSLGPTILRTDTAVVAALTLARTL